ncbi:MAG: efflux RND transporter permease subunit [Ignavibacteriota bacterium]
MHAELRKFNKVLTERPAEQRTVRRRRGVRVALGSCANSRGPQRSGRHAPGPRDRRSDGRRRYNEVAAVAADGTAETRRRNGPPCYSDGGRFSFHNLPVEAYPDIADNYVTVITQWPGRSAEEVEQQVTIPIEIQMRECRT